MSNEADESGPGQAAPPAQRPETLVVGLGASAGGLEALEELLSHVPAGAHLCFVVVQHLEPSHPSMLVELLARHTTMPVSEAADGLKPEPGSVWVIAPGTLLTIEAGVFRAVASRAPGGAPIDTFFRSLAEDQGERAVGIVLSGAGHDGTAGLRAIKERGGMTLAQSPETARHESMPLSAIEAGLVDHVLPAAQMPARLLEHAGYVTTVGGAAAAAINTLLEASLDRICALIHQHTGHDFSRYKDGTLLRRIHRRMQVQHAQSVEEYLQLLETATPEREALLKDLLIGVTQFFRDPEAFLALAQQVMPLIVQGRAADAPIRIWVPGCASGEEAYSLAILVREHLERVDARRFVQIFATDLDAEMLAEARHGRYPAGIGEHVSTERLTRFFVREGQTYQAVKELREMCIFSEHSLIRDPPFSQLDLISCRNVLIYLGTDLQRRLVPLFHYALRPGGYLFLGPSEGIAGSPELFEATDKRNRIFRRRETVTRPQVEFPLAGRSSPRLVAPPQPGQAPREPVPLTAQEKIAAAFERTLRDEYTSPSAVVNERGDALFVAGPINRYMQLPAGPVAMPNLFETFRGGLRHELRTALRAAQTRRRKIVRDDVPVEVEDRPRTVRLVVRPMPAVDPEAGLFLVVVQDGVAAETAVAETAELGAEQPAVEQLEVELRSTRAELRTTVEELESANEELKSSNEELISTNEELQSANEEMQTSKEELQSLNEELETVNAELRQKVDELGTANSDLQNLFTATEVATIFLDRSLRVVKFTPAATALFHLIDADVGRPLTDLAPRFAGQDLVSDAGEVLRLLTPIERQVQSAQGAWFVVRVLPYRTIENTVAGVIVTFVDVSEVKRAEESARQRAQLLHLSHDAILVWRFDTGIEYWNRGAEELYGYAHEEAIGRVSHQLLKTVFPRPVDEVEAELRSGGCWAGELVHRTKDARAVTVLANLQLIRGEDGALRVLEANRDITERKQMEARQAWLASFPERNPNPVVEVDRSGRIHYVNPAARGLFPGLEDDGLSHPWLSDWTEVARTFEQGDQTSFERSVVVGEAVYHQSMYYLRDVGRVRIYGRDVTERRKAEDARARLTAELADRVGELQAILDAAPVAIWIAHDPECRTITGNAYASQLIMRTTTDANISASALPGAAAVSFKVFRDGVELAAEELPAQVAAATGHRVPSEEQELVFADGRRVHMILGAVPLLDGSGRPRGSITAGIDVTALKLAERQLRESEERLRTLASNAQDAITRFDRQARYVYVNPFVTRLLGLPAEAIVGKTVAELGRSVGADDWEARLREVFDAGQQRRFDRRSVEGRWYDVQLIPELRGAEVETVLSIARDVTDRKQAEDALHEANLQLAEADRRKNEFLAMLSHELRNPLTPIRNSLYVLAHAVPGSEKAQRAQEVIDRQTSQLARLVDDLLDVTRISRNKIQLQRQRLDLGDLVRRTVEDHRSLFEEKGISVETSLETEPLPIDGDETRLAQAIGNLLQNAAKFTPAGGTVSVGTRLVASRRRAALRVADTGAGIEPEVLRRMFQPFMQADMTLDRSKGGLGLGLALVKGVVELHGGEVCADSEGPGKGAELLVELPLDETAAADTGSAAGAAARAGRRVLIIEDNVDAADSLRVALEIGGHVVEVAYNGPDGLARARQFAPEVVLCDIGLPGMDGFEVARAFRADESLAGIVLVALSGYALPEDLQRAVEAGFHRHLAKPPRLERLAELLASLPA